MAQRGKKSGGDLFSDLEPPPVPARAPLPPANVTLAEVAIDGPVRGTFTYLAPKELRAQLVPGARVLAPFGHRVLQGFYLGERSREDLERDGVALEKLKPLQNVLDAGEVANAQALITPTLLALAKWMSRHYACPLGTTLSAMLPGGVKRGATGARVRMVATELTPKDLMLKAESLTKTKPKQAAILLALAAQSEPISASALLHEADAPDSALKALAKAKLLTLTEERPQTEADAAARAGDGQTTDLALNGEQQRALNALIDALPADENSLEAAVCKTDDEREEPTLAQAAQDVPRVKSFLLQGVTGSGKTEVYIRALKEALTRGLQGIVLVPEIALTPQTAQRFEKRLGRERVAVLHSHVTDGERAEAWRDIRAGKIDVVIGARSALFAPLPRLGIVVIDEEHENAFKQDSTPRYHARDVALKLAELTGAVLVLGSATPSLETLYLARRGRMQHLLLTERVGARPMPPVLVIDMNRENQEQQRYAYLSRALTEALDATLRRGEQAILFMNRRGYATVITCLRCGHTEKCAQCDITMTSHKKTNTIVCHYCSAEKPVPEICAGCGAPRLKHWGMGTERVEAEVKRLFPMARVARMDSDTMTQRTAYLEALGNFRAGQTDVLVGTQMIAKGLDFPNVTLVGVVNADTALHMPDFRSRERTFQLLAQVSGRAGRGEKGGRVIVQTHLPQDPAVRAASRHDFETFAREELQERAAYQYPPFTRLARVLIRGKDPAATIAAADQAAAGLKADAAPINATASKEDRARGERLVILGPSEAPISKLEAYFRHHLMIKAKDSEALEALLNGPAAEILAKLKGADTLVDVDAVSML